ncbi:MAG: isoprenylcysteine carboxylmethyltransferase family protein [Desulfomonile tiedjei]|nr:isoprenylcysteine carboxylmethyltransferase family protein [Desulfomonile tiedjei]
MSNQPGPEADTRLRLAPRDKWLVTATVFLGRVSLILTTVFLFHGSLNIVNLGLDEFSALALNACLSFAFFIQHSGMIRASYQRWSARLMDERYHGASFTIASSIVLIVLVVLWQKSGYILYTADGALRLVFRTAFALSIAGFVWGVRSLGSFDAFGVRPIYRGTRNSVPTQDALRVSGPYRWVRHPLYLFCLAMIWSCPDLTGDRMLFNLLWTGWIVVATVLEERDLVTRFGDDYRSYQLNVPMLIPMSIRPACYPDLSPLPRKR